MWEKRNYKGGIKIIWKCIEEDFMGEFKIFKNSEEEVLKFRKKVRKIR